MPETLSASSVMAVISESDSCVAASRCRRLPTCSWIQTNNGITIRVSRVSCQDRMTIEMNAAVTVTLFCRIEVAVSVSTVRTPATSLASRDWIAPVLVAVKNASSIFCRCANRSLRRSAIAELPIVEVSQFWVMPIRAVTTGIAHIPATSQPSRWRSTPPPPGEQRLVEHRPGEEWCDRRQHG